MQTQLKPLLIVRNASLAIDFYVRALGARQLVRYMHSALGTVSHADLAVGEAVLSLTEELREWNSDAPPSLGGSPVVMQLATADVDELFMRMCSAGAGVVLPLQEFSARSSSCSRPRRFSEGATPWRLSSQKRLEHKGAPGRPARALTREDGRMRISF